MASALVHMTSVSHCMQLGDNLMMLDMETGFEPYSEERGGIEVGSKRPFPELDEDHDKSYLKKRRKQSKPVKLASSDSLSDDEISNRNGQNISDVGRFESGNAFLTLKPLEEKIDVVASNQEHDNNNINKKTGEQLDKFCGTQKYTHGDTNFPLNLSNIKPSTSFADSLLLLQINESNRKTSSIQLQGDTVSPCQGTINDDTESKKITSHENSYLSSSSSPLLYPYRKQIQLPNVTSQINSPLRIFNPEAFCDLCNKEFCNKYFLKTHKANKHGIYMDNISGPPILDSFPSLPFMSYFSTANEILCQNTCTVSRSTTKKIPNPQPSNLFSLKSNGNIRAFCDICQREFCNKYFLRRHKAKIHGIIDSSLKDGTSSDGQDFKAQCSGNINSLQVNFEPTANDSDIYNIPPVFTSSGKETVPTEYVACKVSMKQEKEIDSRSDGSPDPLTGQLVSSSFPSIFQNIQNQNGEQTKDSSLSPGRIKKLGIVNTDAFCDICCKEYCNKYFLRTHKLKCHGIITPEIDRKDDRSNSNSNQMWYTNQSQTTPLNLIITDQGESNFGIAEKTQFKSEETICLICQRSLPNIFLLKMHYAHMHAGEETAKDLSSSSQIPPKDEQSCEKPHNISDLENMNVENKGESVETAEINSNKNINFECAQKLHSMILRLHSSNAGVNSICDVCNIDVGHVSLLEHHVMKHHSCLLEELGNIEDDENSNSQGILLSTYSEKNSCLHCHKIFSNSNLLDEHISEFHNEEEPILNSTPSPMSKTCNLNNDGLKSPSVSSVISQQDRQNLQTPTNSFCDICKKELCNKYFMKTHMQRMHGISIENGAHIGGVVCDICNKELCSKYFLRVHKQNSHGIVDEVFLAQLGLDGTHNQLQSPTSDPALKPSDPADLNHRYFTHFTEVCMICSRRFRGTKWLKAHLLNDHGEEGREKWKEFQNILEIKTQYYERSMKETLQRPDPNLEVSINTPVQFKLNATSNSPGNTLYNTNEMVSERPEPISRITQMDTNLANTSMFSMLINGNDSSLKNYQCSYCSFSTSILAFLFVHERSHMATSTAFSPEGDHTWQCPICLKNFESKDVLEKHTVSHKASGLIEYLGEALATNEDTNVQSKSSLKNDYTKIQEERTEEGEIFNELPNKKDILNLSDKSASTIRKFSFEAKQSTHGYKQQDDTPKVISYNTKNKPEEVWHKCKKCGFVTDNILIFNNHKEQYHTNKKVDEDLLEALEQIKDTLSHIARKAEVPALFAVPQSQDPFTMQAFILEGSEEINNVDNAFNKRFGKSILSSIVFLPVKEKFKYPVTASFKLTPT